MPSPRPVERRRPGRLRRQDCSRRNAKPGEQRIVCSLRERGALSALLLLALQAGPEGRPLVCAHASAGIQREQLPPRLRTLGAAERPAEQMLSTEHSPAGRRQLRLRVLRGGSAPVCDPLEADTGGLSALDERSPSPCSGDDDSVWMPVIPSPLRDEESSSLRPGTPLADLPLHMENETFVEEPEDYSSGMGNPGCDTVWMPDNMTNVPRAIRKVCGIMLRYVDWPERDADGLRNPPINQFGEIEMLECHHEWEQGTGQKLRVRPGVYTWGKWSERLGRLKFPSQVVIAGPLDLAGAEDGACFNGGWTFLNGSGAIANMTLMNRHFFEGLGGGLTMHFEGGEWSFSRYGLEGELGGWGGWVGALRACVRACVRACMRACVRAWRTCRWNLVPSRAC